MDYSPDIHEQCLNELVRVTKGLQLPLPADTILARRLWYIRGDKGSLTPYNGITFWPLPESEAPGTFGKDDIGYGCGCAIVLPSDHALVANKGKALYCRARIRRRFIHQRLANVSLDGAYYLTTKVEHLQINQPLETHRFEASFLTIRCWMREPRG